MGVWVWYNSIRGVLTPVNHKKFYVILNWKLTQCVFLTIRHKDKMSEHNDSYQFMPDLQGSQSCESLFRQARCFSSTYSTMVNFNMMEFINRSNKIQLQSEIIKNYSNEINFPRFEEKQRNSTEQPHRNHHKYSTRMKLKIKSRKRKLMCRRRWKSWVST